MRSSALLLLFITLLCNTSWGQDVITKTNGDKVNAKVLKVTPTEIEYTLYNNQSGPVHTMDKSDISLITYTNGTTEEFTNTESSSENGIAGAAREKADAKKILQGV